MIDNNSKFGTLILLRKSYKIERKKIALQIGRTVITFSLKQSAINNIPVFKNQNLMEKMIYKPSPSVIPGKPSVTTSNKSKSQTGSLPDTDSNTQKQDQNGSFIDDWVPQDFMCW